MKVKQMRKRTDLIRVLLALCFILIVARMYDLQIVSHQKYVDLAMSQQTMQNTIFAKRGEIYMMDGDNTTPVVMNEKVYTISVDPFLLRSEGGKELKEDEAKIDQLVQGYAVNTWDKVFANEASRYAVIAKNVPYERAKQIKEAKITGVYAQGSTKRVYPEGDLAAQVLGFVNADGKGQYGIEGSLNKELTGVNGILKTVKDVNNIPLTIGKNNVRVPAQDGKNVVLSIDRNIQKKTEDAIKATIEKFHVTNASAVVMNPRNGQILAMARTPTYNPAEYAKVTDARAFQTDVTMSAFNPASVCKTFALAAAVDSGVMTPETTYNNTDLVTIDGWPIQNAIKGHTGNISMQEVLTYSLNTGSIQALRLLGGSETEITYQGKEKLYDYYYNRFGLGKYTGIELAESKGTVIPPTDIDGTNARYANMTFGQSLDLTMIQVATAFSAVVNGGDYYTPTLVAGEIKNGEFVRDTLKERDHQAIESSTSETMRKMLHTARLVFPNVKYYDEGVYVGGKTGTAQVVKNGKYTFDETIATYIGYGARSETDYPEYVIMTKVWEDNRRLDGGMNAKPIFDEISQFMVNYLKMRR
ncbi:penicillin-binding protein 2 [Candidatus Saccharibacteria bacterium]|nr:penicillin-binding protein 2 [Candidatus Saccharibacteria bacterium]